MLVHWYSYDALIELRGQTRVISSFLLPCGSQGWNGTGLLKHDSRWLYLLGHLSGPGSIS